ncbi:potassium channel family protein [Pseudomonas kurunegalensis]|uniref:potassium channel family protein n=1 Tax=Pseudomonas kurunegalensis TaxID=485880 RepID=UPI003261952A
MSFIEPTPLGRITIAGANAVPVDRYLLGVPYALVDSYHPGSFTLGGQPTPPDFFDFVYFSFTVLTSTGFGDFAPLGRQARGICTVEQIAGSLFVAILIARLAGVYPPLGGGGVKAQRLRRCRRVDESQPLCGLSSKTTCCRYRESLIPVFLAMSSCAC